MRLADALVEALVAVDARYVFGVSGANIEHFHDAIHRRGQGRLTSIMAKSEAGAALMADGRARVHRTLGVCCATSGGGMCNLVGGIAESFAESVPVLAIIGQPPASMDGRASFQDSSGIGRSVSAERLFGAVSKYMARINTAEEFWPCVSIAISSALGGRPGPSVLLVPRSMWDVEVPEIPNNFAADIERRLVPPSLAAEPTAAILRELRQARAPTLLVGHGVFRSSDPQAVIEFARACSIPVAVTMSARNAFPNHDPLFLGVCGAAGHPSTHRYLREVSDLILVVGASLNLMTRAPLASDADGHIDKRIIAINIDPSTIARVLAPDGGDETPVAAVTLPPVHVYRADAGACFRSMHQAWLQDPFLKQGAKGYERDVLKPTLAEPIEAHPRAGLPAALRQSDAIRILASCLPERGHLLYDAGNCAAAALHWLDVPAQCTSTIALGMGGMGYAVAGAVGAQLGSEPGHRTVALVGDGSFLMLGLEVHTAVDLSLPILFVIFNNHMHGMCVTRQQRFFAGRLECVRYVPADLATVARGLGSPDDLWVGKASSGDELRVVLADYMEDPGQRPGVLELCIGPEEIPPFTSLLPPSPDTVPIRSWL